MLRISRVATALVCAYALALTTILSAWSANAGSITTAAGDISVICSDHNAGTGDRRSGGDDNHHRLCAMLCSLQAGSIDAAMAPASIALPRRLLHATGALARADQIDPRGIFLKDRPVRGPPLHSAA